MDLITSNKFFLGCFVVMFVKCTKELCETKKELWSLKNQLTNKIDDLESKINYLDEKITQIKSPKKEKKRNRIEIEYEEIDDLETPK